MDNIEFSGWQQIPEDVPAQPVYERHSEPVFAQAAEPVYEQPVFTQPAQVTYGFENTKPAKKEKKNRSNWWKIPVNLILAAAVAVGSSFVTGWVMNRQENETWQEQFQLHQEVVDNKISASDKTVVQSGGQTNPQAPAADGLTPAQVYAKNVGAVVAIANEGVSTNIYGQTTRTASSGSGFIISGDGYVVSNYHVVQDAHTLTVILSDGTEYTAQLIGYDENNDVSLMKIDAQDLPYVTLGNSADLVVGDQVCAIGNPLGELTSTLTVGYVSAKDRQITTENGALNMIQTDAAINSGNSGGPLFNTKGEVIGINTAKYSGTSNSGATIEGIGFAIPIDDVKDILSDLKEFGFVQTGYLGVEVRDVDSSGVSYGLPEGAFVQTVVAGGAAEKAGIQTQDIIVDLGGYKVESVSDLLKALRKVDAGQETTVTVCRAGQRINLKITPETKSQEVS